MKLRYTEAGQAFFPKYLLSDMSKGVRIYENHVFHPESWLPNHHRFAGILDETIHGTLGSFASGTTSPSKVGLVLGFFLGVWICFK